MLKIIKFFESFARNKSSKMDWINLNSVEQLNEIDEKSKEKAQVIFEQEAPWKPVAHSIVVVPMLEKVNGFKIDPVGYRRFKEVWITK